MSDVVTVSPQETRVEPVKASSPSWFIARINAVSRIIGALLLCIPMFISLDAVSASTALGIEFVLLWIGGVAPWTVCRKTWPVWIAAAGSFIAAWFCPYKKKTVNRLSFIKAIKKDARMHFTLRA